MQKALFRNNLDIVKKWMLGLITSEQVFDFLGEKIHIALKFLLKYLQEDCEHIDISEKILLSLKVRRIKNSIKHFKFSFIYRDRPPRKTVHIISIENYIIILFFQ